MITEAAAITQTARKLEQTSPVPAYQIIRAMATSAALSTGVQMAATGTAVSTPFASAQVLILGGVSAKMVTLEMECSAWRKLSPPQTVA